MAEKDLGKLQLWQGEAANLPTEGPVTKLYWTNDGKIYKGQGTGKPLKEYFNVTFITTPLNEVVSPVTQRLYIYVNTDSHYATIGVHDGTNWIILVDGEHLVTSDSTTTLTNKTIDLDSASGNTISNADLSIFKTGIVVENEVDVNQNTPRATHLLSEKAIIEVLNKFKSAELNDIEFMGKITATAAAALEDGEIGNLYIISEAGTVAEVEFNLGDMLLVTQSFEGVITAEDFFRLPRWDVEEVVTPTGTQTLINKTINAANNTITNIGKSSLDAALLSLTIDSSATDDTIPTAKAVYTAIDEYGVRWTTTEDKG